MSAILNSVLYFLTFFGILLEFWIIAVFLINAVPQFQVSLGRLKKKKKKKIVVIPQTHPTCPRLNKKLKIKVRTGSLLHSTNLTFRKQGKKFKWKFAVAYFLLKLRVTVVFLF